MRFHLTQVTDAFQLEIIREEGMRRAKFRCSFTCMSFDGGDVWGVWRRVCTKEKVLSPTLLRSAERGAMSFPLAHPVGRLCLSPPCQAVFSFIAPWSGDSLAS